mmetsp:Transcript_45837/g.115436  ORF Transcript_45837/g.115436 Transcript_45837/m.115436 type:complete len:406 (-) Transcript_45837:19-1236(-)
MGSGTGLCGPWRSALQRLSKAARLPPRNRVAGQTESSAGGAACLRSPRQHINPAIPGRRWMSSPPPPSRSPGPSPESSLASSLASSLGSTSAPSSLLVQLCDSVKFCIQATKQFLKNVHLAKQVQRDAEAKAGKQAEGLTQWLRSSSPFPKLAPPCLHHLTRQEFELVSRVQTDLSSLLPFLAFLCIPFSMYLIPFYVNFFPQKLPSVYLSDKMKAQLASSVESSAREKAESTAAVIQKCYPKLKAAVETAWKLAQEEGDVSPAFIQGAGTACMHPRDWDSLLEVLSKYHNVWPLTAAVLPSKREKPLHSLLQNILIEDVLTACEGGVVALPPADAVAAARKRGFFSDSLPDVYAFLRVHAAVSYNVVFHTAPTAAPLDARTALALCVPILLQQSCQMGWRVQPS